MINLTFRTKNVFIFSGTIFLVFLIFLLGVVNVFASYVDFMSYTIATDYYQGDTNQGRIVFTNATTAIVKNINITAASTYGSQTMGLRIYHCDNGVACTSITSLETSVDNFSVSSKSVFSFAFNTSLTGGDYYAIVPLRGTYGQDLKIYGDADDLEADIKCYQTPPTLCSGVADPYLVGQQDLVDAIEITYPTSGSTGLPNFGLWRINYSLEQNYSYTWVEMYVHTTSTVSIDNFLWKDTEIKGSIAGTYSDVMNRLPQEYEGGYASSTVYYAKAYLVVATSTLAVSDTINFSIGNSDEDFVFPTFDFTALTAGSLEQGVICERMPFSYFCDAVDLWVLLGDVAATSTDALPTLSIDLLSVDGSASTSISIISKANIENMLGSDLVVLMRSLIIAGLWISLGLYVVGRIKHLTI